MLEYFTIELWSWFDILSPSNETKNELWHAHIFNGIVGMILCIDFLLCKILNLYTFVITCAAWICNILYSYGGCVELVYFIASNRLLCSNKQIKLLYNLVDPED